MSTIAELFDRVLAGDATAVDEIAVRGAAAVPDLARIISDGHGRYVATALLSWIEVPDRIAILAPLAAGADSDVRDAALRALGRTGDPRATPVIEAAGRGG